MSDATQRVPLGTHLDHIEIRKIGFSDIKASLREGFADFKANRSDLIVLAVVYPLVALFAARLAFGYDVLPLAFPILAGMALVGPLMTLAFDNASRRRDRRLRQDASDPSKRGALLAFAGLLTAIFFGWLCVAWVLYMVTMGPETPASIGGFVSDVLTTAGGWQLIVFGNLLGLVFAAVVLSISIVTFPLILDRGLGAGAAMQVSARAAAANPRAMVMWGLTVAVLLAVGSIPLFIGLAVAMPVLGHASWHLYRRLVAPA